MNRCDEANGFCELIFIDACWAFIVFDLADFPGSKKKTIKKIRILNLMLLNGFNRLTSRIHRGT